MIHGFCPPPPLKTRGPGKMVFKIRGDFYIFQNKGDFSLRAAKSFPNKTKYTMDPGIYYLLEADEDNTNRY